MGKPLSDAALTRLAKILGMLGSNQPGERASAALRAGNILERNGLDWNDILAPHFGLEAPRLAAWCLQHDALLTDFEREVLNTVSRFGRAKGKHRRILDEIAAKVRAFELGVSDAA